MRTRINRGFALVVALATLALPKPGVAAYDALNALEESNALFLDTSLSVQQKATRLLDLLAREVASPSPAHQEGAGTCSSDYVQAHILRHFVYLPGPGVVDAIKGATRSDCSPALSELIAVARAMAGDTTVTPTAVAVLESHPSGFIRETAASALGNIRDPLAVPALKKALSDPFSVRRWEGPMLDEMPEIYLVRREAAMALKRMGFEVVRTDYNVWELVTPPAGAAAADLPAVFYAGQLVVPMSTLGQLLGLEVVLGEDGSTATLEEGPTIRVALVLEGVASGQTGDAVRMLQLGREFLVRVDEIASRLQFRYFYDQERERIRVLPYVVAPEDAAHSETPGT